VGMIFPSAKQNGFIAIKSVIKIRDLNSIGFAEVPSFFFNFINS
jgi:hypothetical protein